MLPHYADVAVCTYCGSTLTRHVPGGAAGRARGGPEQQRLRSVQCSQCAGPLSAREGKRILVCEHCGVRVAVRQHGGVSRWYFPPRIDRLRSAAAGAAWLRDYPGVAAGAREARFVEAELIYAPIWEHRALVTGWEFGYKVRTRGMLVPDPYSREKQERLELQVVREGVKEPRLQERRFYQAATDFAAIGATRPRVTGRELLVPLLAGELDAAATVLDAEGSATEVAERGRRAALQPLAGAYVPDAHLFAFRESMALLYYPLWVVEYQQGGRRCRVIVNGRDGNINAAFAPASQRHQVLAFAAGLVPLAAAVALTVFLAITMTSLRAPMIVAAVILSCVAAVLARRFRAEKEVEYHEPFSG